MRWHPDRRVALVVVLAATATGVFGPRIAASGRPVPRAGALRLVDAPSAPELAPSATTAPVASTSQSATTVPATSAPEGPTTSGPEPADPAGTRAVAPDERLASSAQTTGFTAPGLGVPAPKPPAGAAMRITDVARLRIPAIGLDQVVHEGIAQNVIDAGPAHWPGTATPGQPGNVVLAGHRTSHSAPFRRIGELRAGDTIEFVLPDGRTAVYSVYEQFVVPVTARWITGQAVDPRTVPAGFVGRDVGGHPAIVTIFTCHPIGSARERLVTHAVLSGVRGSA